MLQLQIGIVFWKQGKTWWSWFFLATHTHPNHAHTHTHTHTHTLMTHTSHIKSANVTLHHGSCKSKGKKYVVKQETKKGNLYMLQGSTVTSSLLTVSQAKSHASNNNSL